jgi:lysophospholipase L1-like esterase
MTTRPDRLPLAPSILMTAALLAWGLLPASGTPGSLPLPLRVREAMRNDLPSRADTERMERGYYERLTAAGRRPVGVDHDSGALPGHDEPVKVEHGRLTLAVDDVREFVLRPNLRYDPGRQIPWSTNAWGMRDREYPEAKPPGTFRVAVVGDSIAAGWGVGDHDGFEPRLEASLDARSRAAGGPAVEVLNFSVPGHGPGQRWSHFDRVGWAFDPDLVVYEATPADDGWDERRLRNLLARGVGFDAPVYREALAEAGVKPGLDPEVYRRLLKPLRRALLEGVYRAAAEGCKARGVTAVWVLIPRVGKPAEPADRRGLVELARRAGFAAVIDASDAFDGADPKDLAVGPDDYHPNLEGHARIARALEAPLGALMTGALMTNGAMTDARSKPAGLPSSAIPHPPSVIGHRSSAIAHPPSAISHPSSTVREGGAPR